MCRWHSLQIQQKPKNKVKETYKTCRIELINIVVYIVPEIASISIPLQCVHTRPPAAPLAHCSAPAPVPRRRTRTIVNIFATSNVMGHSSALCKHYAPPDHSSVCRYTNQWSGCLVFTTAVYSGGSRFESLASEVCELCEIKDLTKLDQLPSDHHRHQSNTVYSKS